MPWHKNPTIHLIFAIIVAIWSATTGATKGGQEKAQKSLDRIEDGVDQLENTYVDSGRIFLYERWGGEWGQPGLQIALNQTDGLRATFVPGKEYRITPGVAHELSDTRLRGVQMYLKIPVAITVRLESPTRWVHADTRFGFHEYYFNILAEIASGFGENSTEPMWLTFPQAGRYPIFYSITGETTTGGVFSKVDESFLIQLD